MVFRLGDEPDPYWEYEVQWPNGLIQVGEFVLSREGGERISYDTAKRSVEAAVAAGRMTEEQAEAHLTELVATGFAAGPSSR